MHNAQTLLPAVYMAYMEGEHGERVLILGGIYIWALYSAMRELKL